MSMHDPNQAAQEARRAIKELGLKGIMLNDFQEAENGTKMLFYDQPEYDPFWAAVQELDGILSPVRVHLLTPLVPVYIHPRGPLKHIYDEMWAGRPALLSAPFQFATGVATHVLPSVNSF